jgi:kanamycin kinase
MRVVWENQLGGLTFEVGEGSHRRFIKWMPSVPGIDLRTEAERLQWAVAFTPVPPVVDCGGDTSESWMVTLPVPGETAVSPHWKQHPRTAVMAIGEGLRALHECLPVAACPFSWSVEDRGATVRDRAATKLIDPGRWAPEHRAMTVDAALAVLEHPPPTDEVVVCHGDACAPNTLILENGAWSGHVDVGSMGVADRWADLAIATWSIGWNYGPGWEDLLLASYGVAADEERTTYYRLLWDLGP